MKNFPGWRRLMILPFELSARMRWKRRTFRYSAAERWAVRELLRRASSRERPALGVTRARKPASPAPPSPPPHPMAMPKPQVD